MALQTFTAGQVLTAAQVTALQANDYNQTVNNYTDSRTLTIADLGDRVVMNKATATTITVNTGIFAAGDTLWIHNIGAGVCTITAGTATVTTSGSLALAQNAGGTLYFTSTGAAIFFPTVASSAQGLTLINTTSFSAVSAVNLAAGTFNATYDNYYFTFYGTSSIDSAIRVRLRVGGANETASNYAQMTDARNPSTGGIGNYTSYTGGTQFSVGACKTAGHNLHGWIQTPFASARTSIFSTDIYDAEMNITTGMYKANTSYDALSFFPDGGTLTGTVSVYGYNK